MKILNTKIYFNTFLKKGVKNIENDWGVYYVTGYQGSGKNYFATYMTSLMSYSRIKTNVQSLKIPGREMIYFNRIEDIINDTEKGLVYIIDEVSKKYDKNAKCDKPFYAWLQQTRKRERIVILITQEWKEVPMWLRRPARFMFHTHRFLKTPFFITTKGDAINATLNPDSMEWECPIIEKYIYKRNKCICDMYDTFEPIQEL